MYINTSESFNSLITKAGRTFRARILLGDNVLEGLSNIKTSSGSNNGEALTLGSTISQMVEITMETPNVSLAGREFELQIGLKIGEDNYEYLPMGLFTPEKITNKQKRTSFTAYDRMMKLSGGYASDLPDETNTINVLNEISAKTGVPIKVTGLTAIPMKKPVGYIYREILMYVAQMYGSFANVNREGTIELHFWEDAGYKLDADAGINGFASREDRFTVECLSCATGQDEEGNSISISAGIGTKGIAFSNPFMTEEILNAVFERVKGFSYIPVECPVRLGDPRLDPWDLIEITDGEGITYQIPIMSLEFDYDGGLSCTIACTASEESEQESDYKGPMAQFEERIVAQIAVIEALTAKKISVDELEAKIADIGYLKAEEADIKYAAIADLNATNASITSMTARVADIEKAYISEARVEELIAGKGYITALETNNLLSGYATVGNLTAATGRIADLEASRMKTEELEASVAKLGYATITSLTATNTNVTNLQASVAAIEKAYISTAQVNTLLADYVKTSLLESEVAKFGYLKATNLSSEVAKLGYLTVTDAKATYATITNLNATNADVGSLSTKVGDISTLMFGSASGSSLTTEFSNSVIALIADATISSAKIVSLVADKITSGSLSTNKVSIKSDNGRLQITGDTILIKDASRTRVQIGKDANSDYNIYILDESGKVMFDATGIHADAIKSPIIEDAMVADEANISASKLDIDSLFSEINGSSNTIKSTKIYLDEKKQTLDVAFSSVTTSVTDLGKTVTSHGTSISTIQGQIANKIWQQDIDTATGGLSTQYSSLNQTVNSLSSTVAEHTTQISKKADSSTVTAVSSKVTSLEQNLSGFQTTVSNTYATKTDVNSLSTRITQTENSISSQVSSISEHGTKISKLEQDASGFSVNLKILETDIDEAKKTATNYMKYDSSGLCIGDMTKSVLGRNVNITSDRVDIRNGTTVLASFGSDKIELGKENVSAIIELCGGIASIYQSNSGDRSVLTIDSDQFLYLESELGVYQKLNRKISTLELTGMVYTTSAGNNVSAGLEAQNYDYTTDTVNTLAKVTAMNGVVSLYGYKTSGNAQLTINNTDGLIKAYGNFEVTKLVSLSQSISYTLGSRTDTPFHVIAGDANGMGVRVGGGGLVVIGSGESASSIISDMSLYSTSEYTYITSDNEIYFYTNCQTIANKVNTMSLTSAGASITGTLSVSGTSTLKRIDATNAYLTGSLYVGGKTSTSDGKAGVAFGASGNITMQGSSAPALNFIAGTATSAQASIKADTSGLLSLSGAGLILPNAYPIYGKDVNGSNVDIFRIGGTSGSPICIVGDGIRSGGSGYTNICGAESVNLLTTSERIVLLNVGTSTYTAYFRPNSNGKCTLGHASYKWHTVYASNASINTSDRREKENIMPFGKNLITALTEDGEKKAVDLHSALFDKLQPVQYNFINGNGRICYGLIAQDVIEALRELEIGEDELDLVHHEFWKDEEKGEITETYGIAYNNLIAMLIHEVQKLKAKIA